MTNKILLIALLSLLMVVAFPAAKAHAWTLDACGTALMCQQVDAAIASANVQLMQAYVYLLEIFIARLDALIAQHPELTFLNDLSNVAKAKHDATMSAIQNSR